MQEITGAKPVRDAKFIALKAFSAMRFLGTEVISSVQFRVGAPILSKRPPCITRKGGRPQGPQSSQRSSRSHTPAVSRAALETATVCASTQQPADFFCKEFLPGQHRLEDPQLVDC